MPRDDVDVPLNRTETPDRTFQDYCVISPIPLYPNEKDWEIPRENLVSLKVVGKGAFGQVAKGTLLGGPNKDSRPVAIKMLRGKLRFECLSRSLFAHNLHLTTIFFAHNLHFKRRTFSPNGWWKF